MPAPINYITVHVKLTAVPAAIIPLWSDHRKLSGLHLLLGRRPTPQSDRHRGGQGVKTSTYSGCNLNQI